MARHRHRGSTSRSTACRRDSAALPPIANDRCTSSRADFIPSWLHHVQASHIDSSRDVPRQTSPIDSKESSWHPNGLATVHVQSNYDAGRYQSSDLFIQDSPTQSSPHGRRCHHHHHQSGLNSDYDEDSNEGEKRYHSNQPTPAPPAASLARHPIFEKRPRRKTREDRYNTVKPKAERVEKGYTKRSSTRVSKKERLRSSREVMANFTSSAIANPNERITLEQTFTPGLFVNGRSSVPSADLAFNNIPLPYENAETIEKEQSSKLKTKERERRKSRQDEVEVFADALKRLIADYPPPESPSLLNSTGTSNASSATFQPIGDANVADAIDDAAVAGKTYTASHQNGIGGDGAQHNNGDGNERSLPRGSHTPHSLSTCSHPTAVGSHPSDSNMLNKPLLSGSNFIQGTQTEPAAVSCEEDRLGGCNTVESPKYKDKSVMVSPWLHQRVKGGKSYGQSGLRTPNTFFKIPTPEINPERQLPQSKFLKVNTANIENRARGDPSPVSFFDRNRANYASHILHSQLNMGLASFDGFNPSKVIDTQSRDAYSVDWPAQPTPSEQTYQPRQEAFQDFNTSFQKTSHIIDDIPGESLKEYIERMEREILGDSEPSTRYIDETLLSTEAVYRSRAVKKPHRDIFDGGRHPDEFIRSVESKDRLPRRDLTHNPVREDPSWPLRQYQGLSYPEESPDESGLAFSWKPNYMTWC